MASEADFSQDPAPLWEGVPEVVARGSSWEVGFAHGSQISRRIAQCIANYQRLFLELAEADWPTAQARAQAYLPALEQHDADLVEEMRGIAAGAGVAFLDILALNVRSEVALTHYSDGCTALATAVPGGPGGPGGGPPGGVFVAQNWDWVPEARATLVLFDLQRTGAPRIRMMGEAGLVGKFGYNAAGVGVCMNAIRCGAVDAARMPVHVALRRVLESPSFDAALALLARRGVASCANLVVADRSGRLATVECTPRGLAPIGPAPGARTVVHTNHLYSPAVPAGIRDRPAANSFARLDRIRALSRADADADAGQPDADQPDAGQPAAGFDTIRAWLSDEQGAPAAICRAPVPHAQGMDRMETLATVIMDLTQPRLDVSFGRPSLSPPVRTLLLD